MGIQELNGRFDGMHLHKKLSRREQEIVFFLCYFVAFPILTDLQYIHLWHQEAHFLSGCIFRVVEGLLQILAYSVYYFILAPRFLFAKKYGYFLGSVLAWIVLYAVYDRFVMEWGVSKMTFLPAIAKQWATGGFQQSIWVGQAYTLTLTNLLVITALAYFLRSFEQERQMNELKEQQLQLELEYLKAQMNPHFFFNTLNNIYSLAQQQSSATAPLVARLSEMMRYVLYGSNAPKVPLANEIDFLQNYISVERIRYPDNIDIRFECQGKTENALIEPLLLIPFIENAFKHGIQDELTKGYVEVIALLADREFTMEVRNSKPRRLSTDKGVRGLGLLNVQKRLALLYPGKYALSIADTTAAYEILLTLQLA